MCIQYKIKRISASDQLEDLLYNPAVLVPWLSIGEQEYFLCVQHLSDAVLILPPSLLYLFHLQIYIENDLVIRKLFNHHSFSLKINICINFAQDFRGTDYCL